jgi:chromosome segregation ATPase
LFAAHLWPQAAGEVQQLQQQLAALRAKAADTARQLSAARTAAKEAGQGLAAEQARSQHQAGLLDELAAELDKTRRCACCLALVTVRLFAVCCLAAGV